MITVTSPDATEFLDALCTNKIGGSECRVVFLNTKGKILFQSLVSPIENGYTLTHPDDPRCFKHLKKYALGRNVNIAQNPSVTPYLDNWQNNICDFEWGTMNVMDTPLKDTAIHYSKGCYLGQEVVSRVHHLGKTKFYVYRIYSDGILPDDHRIISKSENGKYGFIHMKIGDDLTYPNAKIIPHDDLMRFNFN